MYCVHWIWTLPVVNVFYFHLFIQITKKLAGKSAKTAAWCTNISNEHGQVVQSVLTAAEGYLLDNMIQGLIQRYTDAEVPPPELLYVDAHCCGSFPSTNLFRKEWPHLQIRLDVWHFMRRFNSAVTTDTHRLYPTFMSQLSHAIFQWDRADVVLLKKAKRGEMLREHITDPSEEDVIRYYYV